LSEETKTSLRKQNMRLYQIWANMRYRCNTPTNKAYKWYGGKGITYSDEWGVYDNFYYWSIENGYDDNLTLDRIDPDGNYEPNNCRWITMEFQNKNKANCYMITINGESKTSLDWCEIYNLNHSTFFTRRNTYGWDDVKAITTPVTKRRKPVGFNTKINENKSQIT
jgi:hypothetical protein